MKNAQIVKDCETLALLALAHVAGDADMGPRFLGLTGLDAATLRAQAGERPVLAAVLAFLASHEPDLLATAAAIDVSPQALVQAGTALAA